MKKLILILATLVLTSPALAQLIFAPGVGYVDRQTEATQPATVDQSSAETRFDLKLGYVLPMGLYLGGMYAFLDSEDCVGNTCSDSSGFYAGPSIGYHSLTGFYALFTYQILGEVGDTNKLTGAQGPQVDLGWVFPLTSYFAIGPQITYRSIEYDKLETPTGSQDTDTKDTSIAPYVSLWFMF